LESGTRARKKESVSSAPCKGNGSTQPSTADIGVEAMVKEWEVIKKRVNEIDKKSAFAADLTKVTVYSSYFLK
jgi:hypothetical protein